MAEYSTRAIELAQQLRDKAELNISQRSTAVVTAYDPIMKKHKKQPVVPAEDVAYWHERMALGRERFTPVVEKYFGSDAKAQTTSLTLANSFGLGTFFGMVGLPISAIAATVSEIYFNTGAEAFVPILVGSFIAIGFGWQPFFITKAKKAQYFYQQLLTHTSQGLVSWMQTRYGLTLSHQEANVVADAVLGLDREITFTDAAQKSWLLKLDKKSEEYQVEEIPAATKKLTKSKKKKSQQLSLSKDVTSTKFVALQGEAGKVFTQIETHFSQLAQLSLHGEKAHVLTRVTDDVREVVSAYERLQVLSAGADGEKELVRVLNLLDDELVQIIQDEISIVRGVLVSHGDYVQARQKNGLQLPVSSPHAPF